MKKRTGVTLAELLIAVVIVSNCMLLLMGLFSAGSIRIRQARAVATASFLAKQKMEELLVEDDIFDDVGEFAAPFSEYQYVVRVGEYPGDPLLQQIEVIVTTPKEHGGKKVVLTMLRGI